MAAGGAASPPSFASLTNVELFDGSSWTETTDMTNDRQSHGSSGTQTATIMFGGQDYPPPSAYVDKTEYWNGSSWTELNDLNTAHMAGAGWGTAYTAAMYTGGGPPADFGLLNEVWDGTSWSESAEVSTPRSNPGGTGTTTNSICFGGTTPAPALTTNTEHWNGSSWTEVGDMGTGRNNMAPVGNMTNAIIAGGYTAAASGGSTTVEEWTNGPATFGQLVDGQLFFNSTSNAFKVTEFDITEATWSSGGSLNDGRTSFTGIGIQTAVVAVSGQDGSTSLIDSVEEYNGSTWTEVNDTPVTLKYFAAGGILTAGWVAAGVTAWNAASFNAETYHYDGTNWTDSGNVNTCLLYTSPSPRDLSTSRMPSSA